MKQGLIAMVLAALAVGCSSSGSEDCLAACRQVANRCDGDASECVSFCEVRDSFDARSGCGLEQAAANECESSASSCGTALSAVCVTETTAYLNCNIAYCRANPSDALCMALCADEPAFCP